MNRLIIFRKEGGREGEREGEREGGREGGKTPPIGKKS